MHIRRASIDDIAQLCHLLEVLFTQEADFYYNRQLQEAGLHTIISNPHIGTILVACENEHIMGMVNILFTISTALGSRVAVLEDMVVLPHERGHGIGSLLLNAAVITARQNDCLRIGLLTDGDNERAHHFYKKHGFIASQMIPFRLLLPRVG